MKSGNNIQGAEQAERNGPLILPNHAFANYVESILKGLQSAVKVVNLP
jgi:hypothetical protein